MAVNQRTPLMTQFSADEKRVPYLSSSEMAETMLAAQESHRRDQLFHATVAATVAEVMRHFDHMQSDVDWRDLEHAATLAAMITQRLVIDGDSRLKAMEFERDAAKSLLAQPQSAAPAP